MLLAQRLVFVLQNMTETLAQLNERMPIAAQLPHQLLLIQVTCRLALGAEERTAISLGLILLLDHARFALHL